MNQLTKVLIIDDSEDIIESVSLVLRLRWPQLKVIFTDKGEYGIELVEKESPDLVILDIGLPDINGFEVLKSIRYFSSVPIVILTVRGEETDIVRGLELGADEYVVKPFRQLELLSRIKAIIRRPYLMKEDSSITIGTLCLDPIERIVKDNDKRIYLTRIESIILSKLMENAGKSVANFIINELKPKIKNILIFCGTGNN